MNDADDIWSGHEFIGTELVDRTADIFDAALDLPASSRDAFVRRVCAGSAALEDAVRQQLAYSHEEPLSKPHPGVPAGHELAGCLILRRIGGGAAGDVYKALRISLRDVVALKVLPANSAAEITAARNEAGRLTQLRHQHVVSVYDLKLDAGLACIVMELVEGFTLREWLDRQSSPSDDRFQAVRAIVRQIASALQVAHGRGIVHRDLKPENVLLSKVNGEVRAKVVDFGIATIPSRTSEAAGTPGYIPPEVLLGSTADTRADIFALGVIAYELLTGRHPFSGKDTLEIADNVCHREPPPLDGVAPSDLTHLVRRALAKRPEDRYASVEALMVELNDTAVDQERAGNVFLSEFPARVRLHLARDPFGLSVAAASTLWGVGSLLLAVMGRAACIRVLWQVDGGGAFEETVYGFAVEPNAGLWYAIGASLTVVAGLWFVQTAHLCVMRARLLRVRGQAISDDDARRHALAEVARYNSRWFTVLAPGALAVAVLVVAVPEIGNREAHAFGWVQADLPAVHTGMTYQELRDAGKTGRMPLLENRAAKVEAIRNGPDPPLDFHRIWFWLLLASALLHQAIFVAFLIWIACKVVFFFVLLSLALMDDDRISIRLTPDLADRFDFRFGLGGLDAVFNSGLIVIALALLLLDFQAMANWSKGTYLRPDPSLVGQFAGWGTALVAGVVMFAAPAMAFVYLITRNVGEKKDRLAQEGRELLRQIELARSVDERDRLQLRLADVGQRRDTAGKQRLLPLSRPWFLSLVSLNTLLLVLIVGLAPHTDTGRFSRTRFWEGFGRRVCELCSNPSFLRDR